MTVIYLLLYAAAVLAVFWIATIILDRLEERQRRTSRRNRNS